MRENPLLGSIDALMPDSFKCPRIYLVRYGYITILTGMIGRQAMYIIRIPIPIYKAIPRLIIKMIGAVLISG